MGCRAHSSGGVFQEGADALAARGWHSIVGDVVLVCGVGCTV